MVKAEIYRNSAKQYDILVLDMEEYISTTLFEYIAAYLWNHLSRPLAILLGPNEEKGFVSTDDDIQPCLGHRGVALKLTGLVPDRKAAKQELECLGIDILTMMFD
jgi:hypothetical protein